MKQLSTKKGMATLTKKGSGYMLQVIRRQSLAVVTYCPNIEAARIEWAAARAYLTQTH